MEHISPQVKILKALIELGGEANSLEIMRVSGMDRHDLHGNGRHLINRGLAKKKTLWGWEATGGKMCLSIWTLYPTRIKKIEGMIAKAYPEAKLNYENLYRLRDDMRINQKVQKV